MILIDYYFWLRLYKIELKNIWWFNKKNFYYLIIYKYDDLIIYKYDDLIYKYVSLFYNVKKRLKLILIYLRNLPK